MKSVNASFRLIESKDKEGKDWEVCVIQPGMSLNNKRYRAEVLKKALPLFENLKAYAYKFEDKGKKIFSHIPDFIRRMTGGLTKNLVGWFSNPRWGTFKDDNGQTQEGVLAGFHVSENAKWLRDLLTDTWTNGKKALLGFSIDGDGEQKEVIEGGKKFWDVEEIRTLDEGTVVTSPAAGGQFVRLLADTYFKEEVAQMDFLKILCEKIKKIKEALLEGVDLQNVTAEQELILIKGIIEAENYPPKADENTIKEETPFMLATIDRLIEMLKGDKAQEAIKLLSDLKEKMSKNGYPSMGAPAKPVAAAVPAQAPAAAVAPSPAAAPVHAASTQLPEAVQVKIKEINDKLAEMDKRDAETKKFHCKVMLDEALSASNLNQIAKDKIKKMFEGQTFEKPKLEEAVKIELDYLARLSESGHVTGLGSGKPEVIRDEADRLLASVDKMMGNEVDDKFKDVKAFTSIKDCYRTFHPDDPTVSGIIKPQGRFSRLMENITTGDFTYALTVSATKRAAKEYKVVPFPYEPIVSEVGIDNFKQQEIIKWGGFSTLPTVAERGTYADLYEPHDERAVYTPGKKGGIVYVTRETIKNDDLRYIQRLPVKIGVAARRTRNRDVSSLLTANGTYGPTNTTVFSTLFENYSTNAFGYDALRASKIRIKKQRERGTAQSTGTATAATSTSLSDTNNATILDDAFNTYYLRIVYGTGAGQIRLISATATSGSTITVSTAWTTNPSTDSLYEVSVAANSDEKIGLKAKYIIHGDDTEAAIKSFLDTQTRPDTAERAENEHYKTLIPINSPYFDGTSAYYWVTAIDKTQGETIEIGYIDNQREPTLLLQDQPAVGNVFTADEIRWKVRFEYGLAIVENKGFDLNAASSL